MKTKKPNGYWTKEKLKIEALKYSNKKEFEKGCASAYVISKRINILDEITTHMIPLGSIYKRHIYRTIFPDKSIYIGLTCNFKERKQAHLTKEESSVYKYIVLTNQKPIFELVSDILYSKEDAAELECFLIEQYKELGYNVLNQQKGGGLGSSILVWTKEKCQKEALKYQTRAEFSKNSLSSYRAAHRNKWLKELCKHMEYKQLPNDYWTKERLQVEALKYETKTEFIKNNSGAYSSATRQNLIDTICSHMILTLKPKGYWTPERLEEEALKYKTKTEFRNNSESAYSTAKQKKILNEITSHMIDLIKPFKYWNFENCYEEAKKYNTRAEFRKKANSAYVSAHRNKWLQEISSKLNWELFKER